ncbi:MAG: helix-turn-helix domain-containing protein [Lachnospiraceae bacterium]|nr:helix-turn-helix domain-containing protein [Lachnospiraceae bacterium]
MTEGERVKKIRKYASLTLEKFGERLGVTKAAMSRIENGINGLTDQMSKSICREFKVSEAWLRGEIDGDEIIFEESPIDDAARFAAEHNLGDTEAILIREYLNLTDKDRDVFCKYLKSVLKGLNGIQTAADQPDTTAAIAKNPGDMTREELHAELDRQLDLKEDGSKKDSGVTA